MLSQPLEINTPRTVIINVVMRNMVFVFLMLITQAVYSQNDTLYLLMDDPFFRYKNIENIKTGFIINSKDKRFVCDYFMFQIQNFKGWGASGEDIYLDLKELRKEIDINSIDYETIESLQKNKEWYQIHNFLSLKKQIYLIQKKQIKIPSLNNKSVSRYYLIPMIYEGTRKNIIPTNMSN